MDVKGYTLIEEVELNDINSKGYVFRHDKTKARVAVVSNDDNNKVFTIGFRTPPKDSTGAAHIVEHTVLCGSRKFKAKDPFIELTKGSLNTFLNAMTYPDKTVYPVASCNDKDFDNLCDVYLDSVFYPNIYNEKKIFMQEGWHYELDSPEDEITYKGVVYNEMRGAFSSPEQVLYRSLAEALYPDTTYATESGGNPKFIPDLTYEQFLDFHRAYYHPSNSYIYLYGDMDFVKKLEWMDEEYLGNFDYRPVDSQITLQKPFDKVAEYNKKYCVSAEEEESDKTFLAYTVSVGESTDYELCLAFELLSYVLTDAPGAPLKQLLLDKGFGRDISSDFESEIRQPYFTIVARDANEADKDEFVKTIKEELSRLVKEGLDREVMAAALLKMEFKYREADYDNYPKGLIYGLDMFANWLYDDSDVFASMQLNKVYASLREKIDTGYYEELVKKYIIDNTHASVVVVSPDKTLGTKIDEDVKNKLKEYKDSLTKEQIDEIVKSTKELKEYQQTESTKEQLATIPQLKREDITRLPVKISNTMLKAGNTPVIWHDIFTNGIVYAEYYFDLKNVPLEFVRYLGLYTTSLGYFDTKYHSYSKLAILGNLYTGGVSFDSLSLNKSSVADDADYKLRVSVRFMENCVDDALNLIKEILCDTLFNDDKHLREVIRESRTRMFSRLSSASHTAAVKRCDSYYSRNAMFLELTSGISYYEFLVDADEHFDERKENIKAVFNAIGDIIFNGDNAIVNLTCDSKAKDMMLDKSGELLNALKGSMDKAKYSELTACVATPYVKDNEYVIEKKNEGIKFAGQVQYVARTGNFSGKEGYKFTGALSVLKTVLGYGYLWNQIRELGGAYGCMVNFSKNGGTYMVSYRDPNLKRTNDVYNALPDFIEGFDVDEDEMTKYVVGTIGRLDTPMTPNMKGKRDFCLYYSGTSFEELAKNREEVIDVTVQDIRALAPLIKNVLDMGNICVVGNENKIEEDSDLFDNIKTLS